MSWLTDSQVVEKWKALACESVDIKGEEFVSAAKAIISIFDLINGMGMPKADMEGNATTLGKNLAAGQSVQDCVQSELDSGKDLKKLVSDGKTSTCALLWLFRALVFIEGLLKALIDHPEMSLKDAVLAGYEISLKPHHGFMTKNIFAVAVKAAPSRADFMKKVGPSEEEVMPKFKEVMPVFGETLKKLKAFLENKGIER